MQISIMRTDEFVIMQLQACQQKGS